MSFPGNFRSDGGQNDVVLTDTYAQADLQSGKTILIELPRGQHDVVLTDAYAQADIPSGETILIELPREFQE